MKICEYEFEREDPNNKGYSLTEVDTYAWIPERMGIQSHRLSLRKNLTTGRFEVYRHYNVVTTLTQRTSNGCFHLHPDRNLFCLAKCVLSFYLNIIIQQKYLIISFAIFCHSFAEKTHLTIKQYEITKKILKKYHKQIPEELMDVIYQ